MMKRRSALIVIWVICGLAPLVASSPASAQVFYRQDFNASGGAGLAALGWDDTYATPSSPTSALSSIGNVDNANPNLGRMWWYNNTALAEPPVANTAAVITMPGQFDPINWAAPGLEELAIRWEQLLENMQDNGFAATTGIPVDVRIALEVGGNWYASADVYPTTDTGVGGAPGGMYDAYTLPFSPTAANWRNLTLTPIDVETMPIPPGQQGAVIGGVPGTNLSGNITGLGFVGTFYQYQTINFNFIEIGVPPIPGDVTGEREVTEEDFDIILANFGMNVGSRDQGDITGPNGLPDGVVDLWDFGQWKDNYPFPGSGSGSALQASVPEPAGLALIALGLLFGCGARTFRPMGERRSA